MHTISTMGTIKKIKETKSPFDKTKMEYFIILELQPINGDTRGVIPVNVESPTTELMEGDFIVITQGTLNTYYSTKDETNTLNSVLKCKGKNIFAISDKDKATLFQESAVISGLVKTLYIPDNPDNPALGLIEENFFNRTDKSMSSRVLPIVVPQDILPDQSAGPLNDSYIFGFGIITSIPRKGTKYTNAAIELVYISNAKE